MTESTIDHAQVRIHPPVLTLLHVIAAFLLNWLLPFPKVMPVWVSWFGILLVVAGLALAFTAINQFRKKHTTVSPHGSVSMVVRDGPYRFTRNPIYLGFFCTLIGFPLALGTYWGIVLSPVFILSMSALVIQHEETYLEDKFRDVYTSYKSRVRRWL
ncbi:MAG TPA: isoprenylcysteine carboxylmethyltransferase family protein [Anaerolineales bacterium]|nr:isoprenylcysteine carboxylmethyltransferase family protein [Anaerolineales bacterium]